MAASVDYYVTFAFLYVLVKMLISKKFQISCTAFSRILNPRYLYRDLRIKDTMFSVEKKNHVIADPMYIFSENGSITGTS